MSKSKTTFILFIVTVALIAILALLGPEEQSLGANVRIVYLHGAWVLTAEVVLLMAALAGLWACSRRARLFMAGRPRWDGPRVLDASVDADSVARQLHAASSWGICRPDEVLPGGERGARVRLACSRGSLDLTVDVDPATARVRRLSLAPAGNAACVQ